MTKDERFLVELYKELKENLDGTIDPHIIAKKLGLKDHLLKNILQGLIQANLVKRYSPDEIGLTERGIGVAESLSS